MKKVEMMVVSTSEFPRVDLDFALDVYRKKFEKYVYIELSKEVLNLQEFHIEQLPSGSNTWPIPSYRQGFK